MKLTFAGVIVVCALASGPTLARCAASSEPGKGVDARAEELRSVVARVTSPDKDCNIANFEQIVESNDARMIEIAVRTLVASDDPAMRGLALRGYLAATRELTLEVDISPDEGKALEAARAQPSGLQSLKPPHRHFAQLAQLGFRFNLIIEPISLRDTRGKAISDRNHATDPNYGADYAIRGDRLTVQLRPVLNWHLCNFDVKPERDAVIRGTVACQDSMAFDKPIKVKADMF